jgi:hypothetical protein
VPSVPADGCPAVVVEGGVLLEPAFDEPALDESEPEEQAVTPMRATRTARRIAAAGRDGIPVGRGERTRTYNPFR